MSEPLLAMLPCEYCGRMTPWDLRFCVPACCKDCGHMPLIMAGVCLLFTGLLAWGGVAIYFSVNP